MAWLGGRRLPGQSWAGVLLRAWIGYDFFLSYATADGTAYARDLAATLAEQDFAVFLDDAELHGGGRLSVTLRAALRRTRCLVVVGTEGATRSDWVRREIEYFRGTGRAIVPIDVHGIRRKLPWLDPDEVQYLTEVAASDAPTPATIHHLAAGRRRSRVLVRARWASMALIVGIAALTTLLAAARWQARQEARRADVQRIAGHIGNARRALPTSTSGWQSLAYAKRECERIGVSSMPVALAAFFALRGTRDFSRFAPNSLTPGVRFPSHVSSLPSEGRALVWREGEVVIQDRTGQLYTWSPPASPVPLRGHTSTSSPSSKGLLAMTSSGVLHSHQDGLFLWDGQEDQPIVEGRVNALTTHGWLVEGVVHVGGNRVSERTPGVTPARLAAFGRDWALGYRDGTVQRSWAPPLRLAVPITAMDIDGSHLRSLALGGGDGRLRVYVNDRDIPLQGHVGPVNVVEFGPDYLLSAGSDGTVRLWSWELGEEAIRMVGPQAPVVAASLSPDGRRIAAIYSDGSVRLWPIFHDLISDFEGVLPNTTDIASFDWHIRSEADEIIVTHALGEVARWSVPNVGELVRLPGTIDVVRVAPTGHQELWRLSGAMHFLEDLH